jgi:colanic acid/amylovoran biosynthesis glycosyltransferase
VRIAYIINQYPAGSHTFIRREIRAIEALGETILRYALRPGANSVDPEDREEERRTRYILNGGSEFVRCLCVMLITRPLAMSCALRQTLKLGWRSDRGILRHLIYWAEAAVLACWCSRDDIAHIHAHFGTNSTTVAMLAWRISGIPYSFTVHGPEEFDKALFIGLAEKIRHCTFVVAISSFGRSQLFRYTDQKHWTKVNVVHCGLEPTLFEASAPATNSRRFICIGRMSEQKGHLILIEAAQRLALRGEDFEIVLCGDGEMRPSIEAMVRRYNLESKIRILGWIDSARIREEISKARALVLPSFAEGLPVVIMETMALGRPVVSTFIAGIPELVIPGENGWLAPAGDVEAFEEAMQACLDSNAEALVQMGKAARKRALLRHNVNTEASKLASLFQAAIRQRKAPKPYRG